MLERSSDAENDVFLCSQSRVFHCVTDLTSRHTLRDTVDSPKAPCSSPRVVSVHMTLLVPALLFINQSIHPSSLSALLLRAAPVKLFQPTTHLDEWARWILSTLSVPAADLSDSLCCWSQAATVSQDQPLGLLSHVPSWLAAGVSPLNNLTASYERSRELYKPRGPCWCQCLFSPTEVIYTHV